MTLNDLEIQKAGFWWFFAISGYNAYFYHRLRRNNGGRPRQSAPKTWSI